MCNPPQGRAEQLKSRILAMVAQKVQDDPFAKVHDRAAGCAVGIITIANGGS